eukprot:tig00020684_g12851.t1
MDSHAQQALKICPYSTEAFYLLGVEAKTREEALRWFEKGIEAGPLVVGAAEFEEARRKGDTWKRFAMRTFYRCLFGAANVLRKMGRYEEAYTRYKELLQFDSHTYAWTTWINPYPSLIECLLGLGKWGEAAAYLYSLDPEILDLASKPSTYLTWAYTRILVALKLGRAPEIPEQPPVLHILLTTWWEGVCPACADTKPQPPRRQEVARGHSCETDPVLALLQGKPVPAGRDPSTQGPVSSVAARSYVREFGKHWRAEPEALVKLIEMDRTVRSRCGGSGPRRECPIQVIRDLGCPCCGFGEHAEKKKGASSKKGKPKTAAAAAGPSRPAHARRTAENEPSNTRACDACGSLDDGAGLLLCSACRQARYCGAGCQRAHWPAHKAACKAAAQRASAAARGDPESADLAMHDVD